MANDTTTAADPEHESAVALYEALVRLVPDGKDRADLKLEDLVTQGGLQDRFDDEAAANRAWRYLRQLGAVSVVGRNGKRPVAHPDDIKAGRVTPPAPASKRASKSKKAGTRGAPSGRGGSRRGSGRGGRGGKAAASTKKAHARPTKRVAAGESTTVLSSAVKQFTSQVQVALEEINGLRSDIGELDRQMGGLESQHNRLVTELVEFRDGLRDQGLAAFFDTLVGEELWVYEERPDGSTAHR